MRARVGTGVCVGREHTCVGRVRVHVCLRLRFRVERHRRRGGG